jgi:Domain of unknown function (DUF4350)
VTRWRAARTPLLIGLLVLLTALAVSATTDRTTRGLLDPAAVDQSGSRAVAQLLRGRGVTVTTVRKSDDVTGTASAGTTILVPFPDRLGPRQVDAVRGSAADLVLVAPGPGSLAELAPGAEITALHAPQDSEPPECTLPAAQTAGPATAGGRLYRASGAVACYPVGDGAGLVQLRDGPRTITVLGTSAPLTNGALATDGNAALALNLLGAHPRLAWFLSVPEGPPAGDERSLFDLIPPGWTWAALQVAVAVVLAALWRGRRLGPVVVEPLPVIVRAAEAVEGRGRLYRRAGALGHAADALRTATRARLAPLLGTEPGDAPPALVEAVSARTGRPAADVGELLYGAAPHDDAALVALAATLDACEREVRRS